VIKIAQITDLHISSENTLKDGLDAKQRCIDVLNDIKSKEIDLIIVSGDLVNSHDDIKSYKWIKRHLNNLNKNIIILPGNHDSIVSISKIFDMSTYLKYDDMYFSVEAESFILVFLDSSKEFLGKVQLEWLDNLSMKTDSNIVIFVHHPLDYCGCEFMDRKYPLQNIPEVKKQLAKYNNIKYIFTGHYHTEKQINIGNIIQYLTPSTWYQINGDIEGYNICNKYGWREIDIEQNSLITTVHYI